MNRIDEAQTLDRDAMINDLYAFQATLKILEEQVARSRNPELHASTVHTLACLNEYMLTQMPSLRRH